MMGVLGVMSLNSCSSSRGFEGYYPENRIDGKGYGYNNVEQPAQTIETATEEVAVVTETETAPAVEEEVATTTKAPVIDLSGVELTPREQKWVNKLGLNPDAPVAAAPKKFGFMKRMGQKLFAKMAERQMSKFDGAAIQGMDIADIFAIVSLSAGVAAWFWFAGFFFGPAAIVFGVLALKRGTSRRGMAIAGIILGAIALMFWILYIAVFTIIIF